MKHALTRYLERRADPRRAPVHPADPRAIERVIVIPALRERDTLPKTLASLEQNPQPLLDTTLVVCVVNNTTEADQSTIQENTETLAWLDDYRRIAPMRIEAIDAASPGNALDAKERVGAARKIGMDRALEILAQDPQGAIISLDADTTVDPNYLEALDNHFHSPNAWAAAIAFAHPIEGTQRERDAIIWYETFLRYWTLGLAYAESPYAHHSVGSAMACTARAYVAVGGMNRRQAGEDFYFLQELAKTGSVNPVCNTVVHPSARISDRVPFGTGRRMQTFHDDDPATRAAYHPETFEVLRQWLAVLRETPAGETNHAIDQAKRIDNELDTFLKSQQIEKTWPRLDQNAPNHEALVNQRMRWFDSFRTLRLLHHLRDHGRPDQPLVESVHTLLRRMDREESGTGDPENTLNLLRRIT